MPLQTTPEPAFSPLNAAPDAVVSLQLPRELAERRASELAASGLEVLSVPVESPGGSVRNCRVYAAARLPAEYLATAAAPGASLRLNAERSVACCEECGARDSFSYAQVNGAWLCEDCTARHDSPEAGATVPAPVSIVGAESAAALEVEVYEQDVPKWAGLQTVASQNVELDIREYLAGVPKGGVAL